MALHPKHFWVLSNQIDRLRAEEDLRQIHLLVSVGSQEAYKSTTDHLQSQIGQVYVWKKESPGTLVLNPDNGEEMDPAFDREGLRKLKAKLMAGR